MMYFIKKIHFRGYFISLYDVKSSFHDFTLIVAAILDFSTAILINVNLLSDIAQFLVANDHYFMLYVPR